MKFHKLEIKGKEVHAVNTWQTSSGGKKKKKKTVRDCVAVGLTHPFVPVQVPGGGRCTLATWKGTETGLAGVDGLVPGNGRGGKS